MYALLDEEAPRLGSEVEALKVVDVHLHQVGACDATALSLQVPVPRSPTACSVLMLPCTIALGKALLC